MNQIRQQTSAGQLKDGNVATNIHLIPVEVLASTSMSESLSQGSGISDWKMRRLRKVASRAAE